VFDDSSGIEEGVTTGFEQWVQAVFDHPVGEPEWFWAPDFHARWESLELAPAVSVAYFTRLLRGASVLQPYSLEQVAQGIWFLVGESSPGQVSHSLLDTAVGLDTRIACVGSMPTFFREFVAPAALGPADTERNPFHIACYMWWDIFPTWGDPKRGEAEFDGACLEAMVSTLSVPSELCQLSALHGLNHWYLNYGRQVEEAVNAFLAASGNLSPRIREYASQARHGLAQ
jgi:hypothetical protein